MAPILLTIQTASPAGSVAVSKGEQLLAEINLDVRATPTEWLLPSIEQLLTHADVSQTDIDAIAVVRGPGSFTGLRVGLATAKGLALANDCPLVGVSSLQCLAMQLPFSALPVCVMLDARKQEVYTALYKWNKGMPQPISTEQVVKPDVILNEINEETLFIGNGALVYRSLIVREKASLVHFAPEYLNLPRASAAARLALQDLQAGHVYSADELMPNYLRPSEAEINFNKKQETGNSS